MAGEGGIPVSRQFLFHEGPLETVIGCQRQAAFAIQIDNKAGSIGQLVISGRCHNNSTWLPIFQTDESLTKPVECGLLRFYFSSHDGGPSTVPAGGNIAVGFDCNYLLDLKISCGTEGGRANIFLYGY